MKTVTLTKWLSQKELAIKINASDLCLSGHFNDHIKKSKRVIAGKTFIFNKMKKPMILGDNLANRELFKEEDKLIKYVKMGSPKSLAECILDAKKRSHDG
jgi:hypothetical protein